MSFVHFTISSAGSVKKVTPADYWSSWLWEIEDTYLYSRTPDRQQEEVMGAHFKQTGYSSVSQPSAPSMSLSTAAFHWGRSFLLPVPLSSVTPCTFSFLNWQYPRFLRPGLAFRYQPWRPSAWTRLQDQHCSVPWPSGTACPAPALPDCPWQQEQNIQYTFYIKCYQLHRATEGWEHSRESAFLTSQRDDIQ